MKRTRTTLACALGAIVLVSCRSGASSVDQPGSVGSAAASGSGGESLEILVWRAGRPALPGLPAARESELAEQRSQALAELREASGSERSRAGRRQREILENAATPDELWTCAARAAAALERYELAPTIAAALDAEGSSRRSLAAREALHTLYGRWFADASELAPYLDLPVGEATRLLIHAGEWEEARSRERLFAELAHAPSGAAAWLADPDPLVRAGAARILGQVFGQEQADAAGALELLLLQLQRELDPRPFHAALLSALQPLEQSDPDQPSLARLREICRSIAESPGDPRTPSAATGIARLPWRKIGPRDGAHVLSGVECLGDMLSGLAAADRQRGASDPDPLVAVFAALRVLCDQAGAGGLTQDLRSCRARGSVFAVLGDPLQDVAVRASAGSALGQLALPSDWPVLVGVLSDPAAAPAVKHALLGSLRSLLPGFQPGEAGADELLHSVAELTAARDPDLRHRSLALCADPRLEPLVRRLDPAFLVARLSEEGDPDLASELLRLIQRFGRPDMLGPLLSSARLDDLAGDPVRLDELAAALRTLANGSPRATLAAATRLASVRSSATGLACLRQALGLVAQLDEASSFELYPAEHRSICEWAWRVVRAGVAAREAAPQGIVFEKRLLEVHLPRGEKASGSEREAREFGAFERAHLSALLLGDLVLAGIGRTTKPQVEGAFQGAYDLAPGPELKDLVLRDRARFRAAANECVKALADYRRLLETHGDGLTEVAASGSGLLGIPDLRSAVNLLERVGGAEGPGRTSTAAEICDWLTRIVCSRSWRAEPASVRMGDLRDLVQAAVDARDRARLQRLEAWLADLPLTQVEPEGERDPPPIWYGLIKEPTWFQELLDLRARLRIRLRELDAQG